MLTARKLTVERGGKTILSGVDFQASDGEMIGILGPSGSGKSTLLMALNGFRPATAGRVTLDGKDFYENFETFKSDIGFVPQDDIVPAALRVERTLGYAAELRLPDLEPEARIARVNMVMRILGLTESKDTRVSSLSGGQRKRVSVGVELLSKPRMLFADEPTSGLDPALERSLTENFRKLADDGHMVIVTTHIMSSLSLYDKLCVVNKGKLAFFGPPDQIKTHFKVDDFIEIYNVLA
ncbi:ABC transporter ATP-binding protein [Microvenator marinus]|uniref:ABC transporter ATP-binding protein n=1 Tax=Microvenator marinus TaxID=2600177 RepID=A0A5B8XSQ4_9DELT|nr:ABC transporter ATP-binding protein [Microvenator marinus]QED28565.1 ABC transporter ATP-binding protein [Microvenator marinus]